jgi:hypothetical protein
VGLVYEKSLTKKRERERGGDHICGFPESLLSFLGLLCCGLCWASNRSSLSKAILYYQALSGPC